MRILIYGDSNTWGYDAKTGKRFEKRYPKYLQKMMPQHEFIEEGLPGRTLCQDDPYDEDRNGKKYISMVIKSHEPLDMIWINLGTNDAKRMFSTNIYSMVKGLKAVLGIVLNPALYRNYGKIPEVWIIRPARMHPDYELKKTTKANFGKEGYAIMEKIDVAYKNVCADWGVKFIDTKDVIMADKFDGIHITEESHKKLAIYLKKKLEEK